MLGISLLTLSIVAVAFAFWTRPYYALSPGSVRETTGRVQVADSEVFIPDGEIGFVTITLTERVTMWEYLWAEFDDTIDLIEEERINGDGSAEEKREEDRRRMQDSKDDASVVALEYLGYEVPRVGLGVQVDSVTGCMSAEGLLIPGDLILSADGRETPVRTALTDVLATKSIDDRVELRVDRVVSGDIELIEIVLGSSQDPCIEVEIDGPERPMLGIGLSPSDLVDYDLPVDVDIDSDRVGGPSAGLAFTLAIIDVLTPGELTGGNKIATTGTININAAVGNVGGIKQKTVAAREAGVELFLVPMDEVAEAQHFAGEDMDVVGVETLQDAMEALSAVGGNGLEVALTSSAVG